MAKNSKTSRKSKENLSIILLLIPVTMFIAYLIVGIRNNYMSEIDRVSNVFSFLPDSLQSTLFFFIVSTVLCLTSIYLASTSYKRKSLPSQLKMMAVVLIGIFLILYNIGQFLT